MPETRLSQIDTPAELRARQLSQPISRSRPPFFSQMASSAATSASPLLRIAHSQMMATRQPPSSRLEIFVASRSMFRANFSSQNTALVFGTEALRHPSWRCQKQPWTNMAARYRGRTISGLPGSFAECRRKRNPAPCNAFRRRTSGVVFFPLMPAIIRERVFASTMSANGCALSVVMRRRGPE